MSSKQLKRVSASLAHSMLEGAGSIFNIAGSTGRFTHSTMARQDRDGRALKGDWERVGKDIRSSMGKLRGEAGLKR